MLRRHFGFLLVLVAVRTLGTAGFRAYIPSISLAAASYRSEQL
ncbi:MAG: hypothetical protein ACOYMS_01990 [Terrimicrobiaceae bacterium]